MFLYAIMQGNTFIKHFIASSSRDQGLKDLLAEFKELGSKGIKAVEIGRYCVGKARVALYKDLKIATKQELKGIKEPMLRALYEQDFSNDNTTFFMLERGLINQDRDALSEKGQDIINAFQEDSFNQSAAV